MRILYQDIIFGMRMLRRNPGFTITAVLCLALGIGACTAVFSMVDTVLLRPLPFPDSDRLVWIREQKLNGFRGTMVSPKLVLDLRERIQSLESVATLRWSSYILAGGEFPQRLTGVQVSTNFFQITGIKPLLGRTFVTGEDQTGKNDVVVIGYSLWQRQFGGDPNLIGRSVTVNGQRHTIVGVMPPKFQFWLPADRCQIWQPDAMGAPYVLGSPKPVEDQYRDRGIAAVGRLKSDATRRQAQAEADLLNQRLAEEYPKAHEDWTIHVEPEREMSVLKETRQSLWLLLGAVGFVLLIACANVANLLLGRAASREKEMAIRTTLGADRWRVARLVLTESLLLALLGASLGLLLTHWGIGLFTPMIPPQLPLAKDIGVDGRMLVCTLLVVILTALVTGVAPAWQLSKPNMNEALKEGGTRSVAGPGRKPLRRILVVCEVALALILITGAGLMIQTVVRLLRTDTGFDPQNVLAFKINVFVSYQGGRITRLPEYKEPSRLRALYRQLLERVASLPGVQSVAAAAGSERAGYITDGQTTSVDLATNACTTGLHDYFRTMGIPLLQGRHFTKNDAAVAESWFNQEHNIIINEAVARQLWPGANPIGKRIRRNWGDSWPWLTVIGVVGDVRHLSYVSEPEPARYIPYQRTGDFTPSELEFVVRTSADPLGLIKAIRSEVHTVDSRLPVSDFITLEDRLMQSTSRQRFYMQLLTIFAVIGLIIAAAGIYGVISYSVARRTHEIGIRMALGAQRSDVFKLVIKQGLFLIVIGLVIGVAGALALTRVLKSLLYGVTATDPMTFILVSLLLTAVGLLACYIPARRATKIDPISALRYE
jgi:putative ABC transport system permease protein